MKKAHLRVLKEISEKIPKELLEQLIVKEKQFTTLKKVVEHALTKPDEEVPPRQKRKLQSLLDSGYLEHEVDVVDKSIEGQIDAIYDKEIAKAVNNGRLPKRAPGLKLINNKGHKYARKQAERIKALFAGSGEKDADGVVHDPKDEEEHRPRGDHGGVSAA